MRNDFEGVPSDLPYLTDFCSFELSYNNKKFLGGSADKEKVESMLSKIKSLHSGASIESYYLNDLNYSPYSKPSPLISGLESKLGIEKTGKYKQKDHRYYFIVVPTEESKKKQRGGPSDGGWSLKV